MTGTLTLINQVNPGDLLGDNAYVAFQKTNAAITSVNVLNTLTTNVLNYGADPTGATDSTTAFNAAVAASPAGTPYTGSTVAVSPFTAIYVPTGTFAISSQIVNNGVNLTWVLADGAIITPTANYAFLNGRILRAGKQDNQYTYGIFYNAVGFSSRNNVPIDSPPAVMGFLTPSQISTYPTCDSVASYADNTAVPPLAIIAAAGTTYTTTAINFSSPLAAVIMGQLHIGMIVQVTNDPVNFYSGFITGWTANSITVSGWFQQGNAAAGQTPPNTQGAWVSPVTKIFAFNGNVTLRNGTGYASQAAGFEIGCLNNNTAPSGFIGTSPLVWGYDCVNLGTFACDTAFNARHNNVGFFTGFQVSGTNNAGTTVYGYFDQTVYGNAVTANCISFNSAGALANNTATGNIRHFQATNTTFGGGSSAVQHAGFYSSALSGATNNYGFYSAMAASGTANFAFFGAGTAPSQLGGPLNLAGPIVVPPAGQVAIGNTTQSTVGATGAASALPANPVTYWVVYSGTTKLAIPCYNG